MTKQTKYWGKIMINKINASIIILILVTLSLFGCQKYNLTVESGEGSGDYKNGEVVEIVADQAKIGFQFYMEYKAPLGDGV